jgi:formylglycine-generating enzyme required for sulfatase activity
MVFLLGSAIPAGSLQRERQSEKNAALLTELAKGPHLGAPEDAVVGIEVSSRTEDGAAEQVRRGAGFVIRCDGFVLAPSSLFGRSIAVAGATESAATQSVTVVIHPGTPQERRVSARPPRFIPRDIPYAALKMEGAHVPALLTLLPDTLKAGDTVQTVGVVWDAAAKSFRIGQRANGTVGPAPAAPDSEPGPGETGISVTSGAAVPGSVVIGPDGTAIGLITSAPGGKPDRFTSFTVLNRATNCVTPLSVPPSAPAIGGGDGEMVDVAGGPFVLPPAIVKEQPDLAGDTVACVAPFKIDRTEVSNKQYLDFWLSLPDSDRRRLGFQSNYFPASWSKAGAPFPSTITDLPVIGVPMPGAEAFAKAHGKRIPTPYEWALAAFGPNGEKSVEWIRKYINDRNEVWGRVKEMHREYLQFHPELKQELYYSPSHYDLPWMAAQPALQNAARWSKQTVVEAEEPLWSTWKNPLYLEAVGTRDFDESACGARDMLLNASELVQPYPGGPINGRPRWMEVEWVRHDPTEKDPWKARGLFALKEIDALPPLSRLYRRALLSPPVDELISLSNMSEIVSMLAPLEGWSLHMTSDSGVTVAGLIPRRPPGAAVLTFPGTDLYAERPRHFREEIGLPLPLDHTDRSPSGGPQLYYVAPTGFRCVK